eukprot:CAMPEP_0172304092 /NCGR_PEP_ID=MMETSP1058-20130122/5534_1 /TAXON_ID=83371 /ORGANISM="Detonula confervacea, Strain CCMP 353" /LENGTH=446 /DNA_ID=CAMNT_0013015173 /DNA_START=85 /DNA_END=1425 /DNA_ORIENTATION=-
MKVASIALLAILSVTSTDAIGFRELVNKFSGKSNVQSAPAAVASSEPAAVIEGDAALAAFLQDLQAPADEGAGRDLQTTQCDKKWYPQVGNWPNGKCEFTRACGGNQGPGFSTNLACCKGAYGGQWPTSTCLENLESPPTTSPTTSSLIAVGGGLPFYYADYDTAWTEATCINKAPYPETSGRPKYSTMLACCKGAYGGQMSGKCLANLPTPPTTSPTNSGGILDFFYPDYDTAWSEAGCSNAAPLPYPRKTDRPSYSTMLACCKGAYGGQMSGACVSELPSPPTVSPTGSGGADFFYPDYDTAWSEATCSNDMPLPFKNKSDRPNFSTMLACCKGAYGNQQSGKCLANLPSPPTESPTGVENGGTGWYSNAGDWATGVCVNTRPKPVAWYVDYDTAEKCCQANHRGQTSHACMCTADPCYSCLCTGADSWTTTGNCAALQCASSD